MNSHEPIEDTEEAIRKFAKQEAYENSRAFAWTACGFALIASVPSAFLVPDISIAERIARYVKLILCIPGVALWFAALYFVFPQLFSDQKRKREKE